MTKRVLAWVLLVGFLLLIVNIMTVQYLLGPSVMVYIIVVVLFIFTNKPLPGNNKESGKAGQSDGENTGETFDDSSSDDFSDSND